MSMAGRCKREQGTGGALTPYQSCVSVKQWGGLEGPGRGEGVTRLTGLEGALQDAVLPDALDALAVPVGVCPHACSMAACCRMQPCSLQSTVTLPAPPALQPPAHRVHAGGQAHDGCT